eukprot:TRINITY_DN14879_c0_g1_i3.p1 TRINITY_DN14879_c0_g1~~TRINITY_DN14879_c0_g1_i3.p1  ORF type:complete len:168 (-),score=29.01 TRINITY_DN14879_c0_g1_i3:480-983(-)
MEMAAKGEPLLPAIYGNVRVTKSEFDNVNSCKHAMPDSIMHATDGMIGDHASTRDFKIVTMEHLTMKNNASVGNVSHFSDEVVMEHLENFAVTGTTSLQHPNRLRGWMLKAQSYTSQSSACRSISFQCLTALLYPQASRSQRLTQCAHCRPAWKASKWQLLRRLQRD